MPVDQIFLRALFDATGTGKLETICVNGEDKNWSLHGLITKVGLLSLPNEKSTEEETIKVMSKYYIRGKEIQRKHIINEKGDEVIRTKFEVTKSTSRPSKYGFRLAYKEEMNSTFNDIEFVGPFYISKEPYIQLILKAETSKRHQNDEVVTPGIRKTLQSPVVFPSVISKWQDKIVKDKTKRCCVSM